jgi:hypothetical protein
LSTGGVHENDMPTYPDDQWPADDPAIAAFAEDLRIIAAGPAPAPRPGLLAAMRQGAVPFESPTAGRRKRMLTKTFVGGLAAKMALGMGVAAASVTMAGATGVLPEPARDVVASVVAAATPFELPDPGVNLQVGDEPSTSTSTSSTSTTVAGEDDEGTESVTERAVNHGLCVSTAAKDKAATEGAAPNSHGKTVSSIARSDCGKEDKGPGASTTTSTTIGSSSTSSSSTTSTTVVAGSSQRSGNSGPGNSGNSNGNGGNSGKGNSGKN